MPVPPQGFRHAAALLITQGARAISADASPADAHRAIERLARSLVALADDMRVNADAIDWLAAELDSAVDRLPHSFDRHAVKSACAAILDDVKAHARPIDRSDLFVVYAPEDRLPVAAPLAVELAKRRVSVAVAGYEVASRDEFAAALAHGLAHHRGGIVLWTRNLERSADQALLESDRVRVIRQFDRVSTVAALVDWTKTLRVSNS